MPKSIYKRCVCLHLWQLVRVREGQPFVLLCPVNPPIPPEAYVFNVVKFNNCFRFRTGPGRYAYRKPDYLEGHECVFVSDRYLPDAEKTFEAHVQKVECMQVREIPSLTYDDAGISLDMLHKASATDWRVHRRVYSTVASLDPEKVEFTTSGILSFLWDRLLQTTDGDESDIPFSIDRYVFVYRFHNIRKTRDLSNVAFG